jgi:hypothetical protein
MLKKRKLKKFTRNFSRKDQILASLQIAEKGSESGWRLAKLQNNSLCDKIQVCVNRLRVCDEANKARFALT